MIYINIKNQKNVIFEKFPMDLEKLEKSFLNKVITLDNNDDYFWLKVLNNQKVNIYDLNYLVRYLVYDIDSQDYTKLNEVLKIEKVNSLNEIINLINQLDNYLLINNLNVYYNDKYLVDTVFIADNHAKKDDKYYSELSKYIRESLVVSENTNGWLIKKDDLALLDDKEIPVIKNNYEAEIRVWMYNPKTHHKIVVPFPLFNDDLKMVFKRLHLDNTQKPVFDFKIEFMNVYLYKYTKDILKDSSIENINNFSKFSQNLNQAEVDKLILLLKQIELKDYNDLNYLISNLNEITLLDNKYLDTKQYVKHKLDDLMVNDFEKYQKLLDTYLDYESLKKVLLSEKFNIKVDEVLIEIPKSIKDTLSLSM